MPNAEAALVLLTGTVSLAVRALFLKALSVFPLVHKMSTWMMSMENMSAFPVTSSVTGVQGAQAQSAYDVNLTTTLSMGKTTVCPLVRLSHT